jgi:hypothetical protein
MTPTQAHEILNRWMYGIEHYSASTINAALMATGDLAPELD